MYSFLLALLAAAAFAADNTRVDYGRDVRPILSENCFHCHGQDAKKRMAGLRLDTYEGATAQREGRAALRPGRPKESGIVRRITEPKPALRMPPAHSNRTLTAEQIATLQRWIAEGGRYSKHWAFTPPTRPGIPTTATPGWTRTPVDSFVLARLNAEGLRPSPAAPAAAWLRRVSLDLTGLPPSPERLAGFAADLNTRGEAAYGAAVDKLLESTAYGERMAMDWLDVARYADTHGFNNDAARSMWRWRDWVIDSFNANMPYDRFLTEQLAGDLLPEPALEQRIATGYGRNHVINSEGGIIDEEYRVEYVADRVRTLGMSWLGLSLECSRCHDHKYDPITQKDHYRFYAFFNNVPEIGEDGRVANAVPMIPAPSNEHRRRMEELEASVARLDRAIEARAQRWSGDASRVPSAPKTADGPAVRIGCETDAGFEKAPGVDGHACVLAADAKPETAAVAVAKRGGLTLAAWVRPGPDDRDAALLSAMDFARNRAATTYGNGIEWRLTGGEMEFRFGQRFPAYSTRVRSEGAGLAAGEWHHAVLRYEGEAGANRGHASWVRMFVDGREVAARTLNDGFPLPDAKGDKPAQTKFRAGWDNGPGAPRFTGRLDEVEAWERALSPAEIRAMFESRAIPFARSSGEGRSWLRDAAMRASDPAYAEARGQRDKLHAELLALRRSIPTVMVMQEMSPPRETRVLNRGAYDAPGEKVEPGVPEELLGAWPEGAPRNRLGLAKWLVKPDHPLTARVVVNRFWQQLFGQGLVRTSENFGVQGESPSHPELLDWLAREFVDSGWDVKGLIKGIVLSATYRQDSSVTPALVARDPGNRLLARGPRFRLPAEIIRDQALAASGLLDAKVGGPSVFPYQPAGMYKGIVVAADYPGTSYVESTGGDLYRRGLYTFWKRTAPHPAMTVFDAPDREFCVVRRSSTNTPLQALTLMNDPVFVEASRKLAERAIREGGSTPESRLARAFLLAAGREPDAVESRVLREAFDKQHAAFLADAKRALALLSTGASPRDESIPAAELAAYAVVANMILNLDEVVTKG